MLKDIRKFFEERLLLTGTTPESATVGIEYAAAALLIELARADFTEDGLERQLILKVLRTTFHLADDQLDELIELAESGSTQAHDLFQFTKLINQHYNNEQKIQLLENFWKVAYADGRVDKYEEQFIRKVTGLLNLAPSEFPKAKIKVRQALGL